VQFCQDHWDRLRAAIDARGLSALVPETGEQAAANLTAELAHGRTVDTFDPLMSAMFAIFSNAMDAIARAGGSPLYLMGDGPEDPVEGYGLIHAGKTWPRCPLCYLGLAHELTCADLLCKLPRKDGYAWMIDRAADDQVEAWKALGA
jgi:hypothetical protein